MPTKVLLDTDIGGDIDDAVALAYLLAQPECDLLGITTVTGRPEERAMLASVLCRVAGREVPIYPGAATPLLVEQGQPIPEQAVALGRWPHDAEFPRDEAVEFLRRTIRASPGEVMLVAIGPLTNVALLFAADPEVAGLLRGIVIIGGAFYGPSAIATPAGTQIAWNTLLDPHAAAIVYRTSVPIHRTLGLDVTTKLVMSAEEVRRRFTAPLLRPVLDFAETWFEQTDEIVFHDPLAAVSVFEPGICEFERGTVGLELTDAPELGATTWTADASGPHEVASVLDVGRFFEHYFGVAR
jgi:purine nucleosidase